MKIYDIHGVLQNVDVRSSSYPTKAIHPSVLQGKTCDILLSKHDIVLEEFVIPGGRLRVDFFMPRQGIVVETNGEQHGKHVNFFHGDINNSAFHSQVKRDIDKIRWCEMNGFEYIEIWNEKDLIKLNT